MTFLIPGKTRCLFCDEVIASTAPVVKLPYVDAATFPRFSELVGRFAHRECWLRWEGRETYALAAFRLVTEGEQPEAGPQVELSQERLVLYWIEALGSYRIQDLDLLIALDFPRLARNRLAALLGCASGPGKAASRLDFDHETWKCEPISDGVTLAIEVSGRIEQELEIPDSRLQVWCRVLGCAAT